MVAATIRSLRLLHETFRTFPLPTRLHILGRYLSCPFERVLPFLPAGGTLLDVGAGHGTFARLAVEHGASRVIALEPDIRKTLHSYRHPHVQFVAGFDDAISGTFDAVTMFDVLYRIPLGERDALFARIHQRLRPGGAFLIKELDPDAPVKFAWNKTQEAISDRLLGITLGSEFAYEHRAELVARFEKAGFESVEVREIDAGYPHSHILFIGRKPDLSSRAG